MLKWLRFVDWLKVVEFFCVNETPFVYSWLEWVSWFLLLGRSFVKVLDFWLSALFITLLSGYILLLTLVIVRISVSKALELFWLPLLLLWLMSRFYLLCLRCWLLANSSLGTRNVISMNVKSLLVFSRLSNTLFMLTSKASAFRAVLALVRANAALLTIYSALFFISFRYISP